MSNRIESCFAPCCKEFIDSAPSVEHHSDPILLENSVGFSHCGYQPIAIRVILNGATCAVLVVHQIRWIGEYEIDAVCWHLAHDLNAISMRNGVDEPVLNCSLCLHGFDLLCGPGVISQDTHPEGARDGCSQGGQDAFSGGPSGGAETRRASAVQYHLCRGARSTRQTKQNPGRRRAQPAFLSRCLRVRRAQEEISVQSRTAYKQMKVSIMKAWKAMSQHAISQASVEQRFGAEAMKRS